MAAPSRSRPVRTLVMLGVLTAAVFGGIAAGVQWSDATWTPKLALDLEGGTQIILAPITEDGSEVTSDDIEQAIAVLRQRVDASGVSEAVITSQGGRNIVVELPGSPSPETIDLVTTSAQMEFRPVLEVLAPTPAAEPGTVDDGARPAEPSSASDAAYWITQEVRTAADTLDCTDPANLTGGGLHAADAALVTCDQQGLVKYVLGPVEIPGTEIESAASGLGRTSTGAVTNEWVVSLQFRSAGASAFADVTTRLLALPAPQNQFGIVLDGLVVSAPKVNSVIANGGAEISGSFTRDSAATLANQLNFGALPLAFEVQSQEQISATLGSESLRAGLVAGLIGLLLVVAYSIAQYRVLGLLTVGSLGLAGVLTYGAITLLSWTMGYRLSLAGVAGLIVAIGITADSFIVYFERIRDELREGRTLGQAVERGWARARRTILASDTVHFLAAAVLYLLAVGGVRCFAFTLGLTTLIDLLVVFVFTHPVMTLLARIPFFAEGHALSGLDPRRLGAPARYAGRGRVTHPRATATAAAPAEAVAGTGAAVDASDDTPVAETGEPAPPREPLPPPRDGMTIAERRAAQRAAVGTEPGEGSEH